ncbi:MAG: aminopeptidase P family protein [Chloroflexi bacterium]|nr:aminopeptidase P family protein [Chloroflexota bacterium]
MSQDRLKRLQQELAASNVDCLALVPGTNLHYLTGMDFHLMERATIGLIPKAGKPAFVLPGLEVSKFEDGASFDAQVFSYVDGETPHGAVREAIKAVPEIQRIAVEHLAMRVMEFELLRHELPTSFVVDAGPLMDALRLFKSPEEIAAMRQSIEIAEAALAAVIAEVKPGMTERQIASRLSLALMQAGGETVPFDPLVLGGPNAANPHGTPGDRPLQAGDGLLIDFGTRHQGYVSDITRNFVLGRASEQLMAVHQAVMDANAAGRAAAKPGVACQEIDRATRQVIEEAGFGAYFIHRTGHGIGLDAHEGPYIVEGNELELAPGMTFTIEPGVYIGGEVGIRVEDNMLVTEDGVESLTRYPRELIEIPL